MFADGFVLEAVAADEVVGGQRNQPGVFINLANDINRADLAEAARVEQPDFYATLGEGHPRIDVGGIIIVVNEDIITLAEVEAGGDVAQGERGGPDQRHFVRLAMQQGGPGLAGGFKLLLHESLLVAQ